MKNKVLLVLKKDAFFKDLAVTFAGQFLVMLISFVINKIVSNQYSVEDYGTYNLIRRLIAVMSYIMIMALGIAIPKYIAESHAQKDEQQVAKYYNAGLIIILTAFIAISIVLFSFGDIFSTLAFGDNSLKVFFLPIVLYSLGSSLIAYAYSYYRGKNNFVMYNLINIVMQIILVALLLFIDDNLYYLYLIWGICQIIYGLYEIINIYIKHQYKIRKTYISWKTIKTLLIYSLPRVPGEFILFSYSLIPLIIIKNRFDLEQVGYFSAALSINSLITPLFSLVGTILLPLVSKSLIDHTHKDVNRKINILAVIYLAVSIIAILFIYLFGEFVIKLLYNDDYLQCIGLVKVLIISVIPNSLYLLLRNPLDGISKIPYNTITLAISFIIYIILLVNASSIEMCAVATIAAYTLLGVLSMIIWLFVSGNKVKINRESI